MKAFYYLSYKNSFHTVQDVISHMDEINEELNNTHMVNLQAFNRTYQIITKNVFAKMDTGFFTYDKIMKNFDIHFAKYYFNALKNYADGKHTTPAWKILFDYCQQNTSYQSIYMAMGINAHVNNDLPFTLYDVLKDDAFKTDFFKVNAVIHSSLFEVINSLNEKSQIIEALKNTMRVPYTLYMDVIILKWRRNAWENYLLLQKDVQNKILIEQKANTIALQLTKLRSKRKWYTILTPPIYQ